MNHDLAKRLVPGATVEVVQQILHGDDVWTTSVRGTVLAYEQQPTGTWFAHARDDKLWLDRLVIRKDDGEISVLNLDQYAVVRVTDPVLPS